MFAGAVAVAAAIAGCNSPWPYVGAAAGAAALGGQAPTNEIEQVYYLGVFDPQEQIPQAVYRVTVHGQGSFISQTKFASGWVPANLVDTLNQSIGFDEQGRFSVGAKSGDAIPADSKPTPRPDEVAPTKSPADESKDSDEAPSEDVEANGDAEPATGTTGATDPAVPEESPPKTADPQAGSKGHADSDPDPTQDADIPESDVSNRGIPTGRRLVLFGPEGFREAPRDHRLVIVMGSNPAHFFKAIGESLQAIRQVQVESSNSGAAQQVMGEMLRLEAEYARLTDLQAGLVRRATR